METSEKYEPSYTFFVKTAPIHNNEFDNSKAHYYWYEGPGSRLVKGLAVGDNPQDPDCDGIIGYMQLTDNMDIIDVRKRYKKLPKLSNVMLTDFDPILSALIEEHHEQKESNERLSKLLESQPVEWKPAVSFLKRKPADRKSTKND